MIDGRCRHYLEGYRATKRSSFMEGEMSSANVFDPGVIYMMKIQKMYFLYGKEIAICTNANA